MAPYPQQFASVYLAVGGSARPFERSEAIEYLRPLLAERFRAGWMPAVQTLPVDLEGPDASGFYRIVRGPFADRDLLAPIRYLTALKWHVRSRDQAPVTKAELGALRGRFRQARRSLHERLAKEGFTVLNWSLQPYGEPLVGDRGVPATPSLPPKPSARPSAPKVARAPGAGFGWGLLGALLLAGLLSQAEGA